MANTSASPRAKAESSGDWQQDQKSGYVAHFDPESNTFSGPDDAFVWFGLPYQGDPRRTSRFDEISGKMVPTAPWLDENQIASHLGDERVKWLAWDQLTQCNVYERVK